MRTPSEIARELKRLAKQHAYGAWHVLRYDLSQHFMRRLYPKDQLAEHAPETIIERMNHA